MSTSCVGVTAYWETRSTLATEFQFLAGFSEQTEPRKNQNFGCCTGYRQVHSSFFFLVRFVRFSLICTTLLFIMHGSYSCRPQFFLHKLLFPKMHAYCIYIYCYSISRNMRTMCATNYPTSLHGIKVAMRQCTMDDLP